MTQIVTDNGIALKLSWGGLQSSEGRNLRPKAENGRGVFGEEHLTSLECCKLASGVQVGAQWPITNNNNNL